MRRIITMSCAAALGFAAIPLTRAQNASDTQAVDPKIGEILKKGDVGYYRLPDLPLLTNLNYAKSSSDVEPYGG
jgi:hypothetical protein